MTDVAVAEKVKVKLASPKMYNVVFFNDNATTMDFVIFVLTRFFDKSTDEAKNIMLSVHKNGKGIVGTYVLEIAETKVQETLLCAESNGYPLKIKIEEERS